MIDPLLGVLVLGAVGLFLTLPRGAFSFARLGGVVLVVAAALLLTKFGRVLIDGPPAGWFIGFSLVTLASAVRVITHRKPVYSALYFVLLVVSVAGLLILMQAELLAYALIIVYAGAILVTYLFVLMLAQQSQSAAYDGAARDPFFGCLAGFFLLTLIGTKLLPGFDQGTPAAVSTATGDSVTQVGTRLLTEYMIAIQVIGALLTAAMVGAIAIARRDVPGDIETEVGD